MRKKIIILFIAVLIIALIIFLIMFYKRKKLIEDIENHYSQMVEVKDQTKLYIKKNNKFVKIGNISTDMVFNLDKVRKINKENKYFKIENTDYYLYYLDCSKFNEKVNKGQISDKYVMFNQNVVTNKETTFLKDGVISFNLDNHINLPLLYQNDNYYYIKYFDDIYEIEKERSELVDNENTNERVSDYISILHYKRIQSDKCKKRDCISISKLEDNLKNLLENGFYTISENELIEWSKNNIRLKDKSIMIVIDSDELVKDLFSKYNLSYVLANDLSEIKLLDDNDSNKELKSLDKVSSYIITENNSNEIIESAINGEKFKIYNSIINQSLDNDIATKIAVLNYHFFYDRSKGESCNESICLEAKIFEEQLKYLKENGYKTLTIDEFKDWMYGDIELPKKSVLLTIDDGAKGTGLHNGNILIPLLEKYQIYATLFLISGWWGVENYQSEYLDIQSHTWNMHNYMTCADGTKRQQLICSSYEEIVNDLTHSLGDVDSDTSFCFPFYVYNETSLKAVKDMGFKLAFIGGGYKASRDNDKYLIPRYPIYDGISLNQFINYID